MEPTQSHVQLTFPQKTFYFLKLREFEALIESQFEIDTFNAPLAYEWPNQSAQWALIEADELEYIDESETQELQAFITAGNQSKCSTPWWTRLLAYLAAQHTIPEGLYLIDIDMG